MDTNCIIDLEEGRQAATYVRALINMHDNRKINLRVVAISASERKPDGKYASSFAEFKEKIAAVGLAHVEILKPIGYYGITFWDWCLYAGDDTVDLERKIHEILFPEIDFAYREFCRKHDLDPASEEMNKRWRNAKCDVLALWSHIHYGSGIFVTRDNNFHENKAALIALGAGDILTPKNAVARLDRFQSVKLLLRMLIGRALRLTRGFLRTTQTLFSISSAPRTTGRPTEAQTRSVVCTPHPSQLGL